jgi:hypothetical protein
VPERTTSRLAIHDVYRRFNDRDLDLAPEFQRNSVWPPRAKAYLIDTILTGRPIPLFFFLEHRSAQSGQPKWAVIDGQQRLRAIIDFLEGRLRLTQSDRKDLRNKRFEDLPLRLQREFMDYGLIVEILRDYSDDDIRDMFVRINRYVVSLSPQELRHARSTGAFAAFVESVGTWPFWLEHRVFSPNQVARMRPVEFAAELIILLIEGPQDKKKAVDLYYGEYASGFPSQSLWESRLRAYLDWVVDAVPRLSQSRFRRPVDLYSLVGALARLAPTVKDLKVLHASEGGRLLSQFEAATREQDPPRSAARYLTAASRQTDNLQPRLTRITTLTELLSDI